MSICCNFNLVTRDTFDKLQKKQIDTLDYLYSIDFDSEDYLSIDTTWHVIHYTLCNSPDETSDPLSKVIQGGEILNDEDTGYGPCKYFAIDTLKKCNEALKKVTDEGFQENINPNKLTENGIYPFFEPYEPDEDEIGEYIEFFNCIKDFFQRAIEEDKILLKYYN